MTPYDSIFQGASVRYRVPVDVIEAVARTETLGFDAGAIGDGGQSYGLFQMYRPTARRYGVTDMSKLLDPVFATDRAVAYMADIIADQGGLNLPDFYSEYNSGNSQLWKKSAQVYEHVQRFLNNYALSVNPVDTAAVFLLALGLMLLTVFSEKKRKPAGVYVES